MNTETLITHSGFDLVEQGDISIFGGRAFRDVRYYVEVLHMRNLLRECRKFMKVGCEQAESMYLSCKMSVMRVRVTNIMS